MTSSAAKALGTCLGGACVAGALATGCAGSQVGPTTCAVVDIAHAACGAFVQVRLENGEVVAVPIGDVRAAAMRARSEPPKP